MTAPDTAVPTVAVLPAVRVAAPRRAPRVKPPTKPTVIRCYRLGHHANPGKVAKVAGVLPAYQATIRAVQGDQWARWLMGGEKFWNRRDPTHIPSTLSARYKRSAQNQAVAGLDSWLEQVKPVVAGIIRNSNLPGELKADLHWLNRSAAHHKTVADIPVWDYDEHGRRTLTTGRRPAPPETLALLRRITKHVRHHRVSVPKLWRTRTMCLDGTVAQVERATDSSFDFWLRVSTTTPGQVVRIPSLGTISSTGPPVSCRTSRRSPSAGTGNCGCRWSNAARRPRLVNTVWIWRWTGECDPCSRPTWVSNWAGPCTRGCAASTPNSPH